jgi:uncharacterized caspase-like protein
VSWTGERHAVVIGVGHYDDPQIPRLAIAGNDALAMYEFLTTTGGFKRDNVRLVTEASALKPTLANIKRALGEWLVTRARKDDLVIVYYSGRGAPEIDATSRARDGLSKYLVPRDADPASLYVTALPFDEIETIFRRLPSERVVFFIDTSFSGAVAGRSFIRQRTRSGHASAEFLDRMARGKGRVVIAGTAPNELAVDDPQLRHGVFTHYLLRGLGGAADADGNGVVTVNELYSYVQRSVSEHARRLGHRQSPVITGAVGDLPLVQVRK